METVKVLLITQARMSSTRFPGKIFKEIQGKKLIQIHLDRLKGARKIDKILVATTENPNDSILYEWVTSYGIDAYRGSESDVLDRFYKAAKPYYPKWVVRVTSDCPLIDPSLVDHVIELAQSESLDYASNTLIENFPDGQDVEIFTFESLERTWKEATLMSEREHVTPYIRKNINQLGKKIFNAKNYDSPEDYSNVRMTVDEPVDFMVIKNLIENLGTEANWMEYVHFILERNLNNLNIGIIRNEGYLKSIENDKKISNG